MLWFWAILEFFDFLEPDFHRLFLGKIDTKDLEFIIHSQFNNIKLSFHACLLNGVFHYVRLLDNLKIPNLRLMLVIWDLFLFFCNQSCHCSLTFLLLSRPLSHLCIVLTERKRHFCLCYLHFILSAAAPFFHLSRQF